MNGDKKISEPISGDNIALLSESIILKYQILPLHQDNHYLYIGSEKPLSAALIKEIQFYAGRKIRQVQIDNTTFTRYQNILTHKRNIANLSLLNNEKEPLIETENSAHQMPPVIAFVNQLLIDAIERQASDIHLEPYETLYRIRYRVDGILTEVLAPEKRFSKAIASRIKILSHLDIAKQHLPQDGRFSFLNNHVSSDCRVSICPTAYGEKIVIRLLGGNKTPRTIDALGMSSSEKAYFIDCLKKSHGMILISGPTGSGKSASLYAALTYLNTSQINISTAEDPIEMTIQGINQVNVHTASGLTFSTILRTFLRQDPDVIMLGEIRDLKTAKTAIRAAQTGHLVLSTVHANTCQEVIYRLQHIGVSIFDLISTTHLLIAQRLIRKLCEECKILDHSISKEDLLSMGFDKEHIPPLYKIYKPGNCNHCHKGYIGRIALFELMPLTNRLKELILSEAAPDDILSQAKSEGMVTLYQAGLKKIQEGITSIEEIQRII